MLASQHSKLPKITLKQLAVFISVYQTQSTSRASETLHLSQSAVSSALTELEDRLSMPLFERVGRRLYRHDNAHAIYVQAQAIVNQCTTLEQYHKYQTGRIHIGASTTIGNYVLPPLLASVYRKLPDAQVQMYIGNTRDVVSEVEQLKLDIGLVEGMPRPTDSKVIEQSPWRTDKLIVFAKNDSQWLEGMSGYDGSKKHYQINLDQLSKVRLLVREPGSGTRQVIDEQLLQFMPHAEEVMAIQHSEGIKNMVKADMGFGCLSQHIIDTEIQSGALVAVDIEGINLQRNWWIIWHKARYQNPIWQVFFDLITETNGDADNVE